MSIWQYLLLFFIVPIGGAVGFLVPDTRRSLLRLVLSFTGAYILGISVLHLLPDVYAEETSLIGLWILGGFFLQIALEQFSAGVEHGHVHAAHDRPHRYALIVLLGLGIHALVEGLPLGPYDSIHATLHAHHQHSTEGHLFWGIILHKLPAAFALSLLLRFSGLRAPLVWAGLLVFAAASPLGALIGHTIDWSPVAFRRLIAVVVGLFLHVSTTILFETDDTQHHRISLPKLLAILLGTSVAVLTVL